MKLCLDWNKKFPLFKEWELPGHRMYRILSAPHQPQQTPQRRSPLLVIGFPSLLRWRAAKQQEQGAFRQRRLPPWHWAHCTFTWLFLNCLGQHSLDSKPNYTLPQYPVSWLSYAPNFFFFFCIEKMLLSPYQRGQGGRLTNWPKMDSSLLRFQLN